MAKTNAKTQHFRHIVNEPNDTNSYVDLYLVRIVINSITTCYFIPLLKDIPNVS